DEAAVVALVAAGWLAVLDEEEDEPQPARISAPATSESSADQPARGRRPRATPTCRGPDCRTAQSVQAQSARSADAGAFTYASHSQIGCDRFCWGEPVRSLFARKDLVTTGLT